MIHFYPYVFLFTTYISGHFRLAVTVVWCILYVIKLAAFYLLAFIKSHDDRLYRLHRVFKLLTEFEF